VTTAALLANPVRVTVGGVVATVAFAGLSGSGLDQLNVTIPHGLADGDAAVVARSRVRARRRNLFITVSALSPLAGMPATEPTALLTFTRRM